MIEVPKCYGIIPARYASTRFKGKPLADILGKPMFWHVYTRACQCQDLEKVVLATDDERIFSAAEELGVNVLMTGRHHACGTDRVLEAARLMDIPEQAVVVNIQGDEPALDPQMIRELVSPFSSPAVVVTTLAHEVTREEAENPDLVKVVVAENDTALYFSRYPIPYPRSESGLPCYGQIGLYAFRMATLEHFVSLGQSSLEKTEKLEQLRLLENGIPIHIVKTNHRSHGVDRSSDIETVCKIIASTD